MANTRPMGNTGRRSYPPRQMLPEDVAAALKDALDVSQMSYREAAREIGISHGYLHGLVHGNRRASKRVAKALIEA